jgi:hypothetical protein
MIKVASARCSSVARLECIAEALLGSASEWDLLVHVAKDEGGFVAGFAMEMERRLEVENEGPVKPRKERRGQEFFVLPEGHTNHER